MLFGSVVKKEKNSENKKGHRRLGSELACIQRSLVSVHMTRWTPGEGETCLIIATVTPMWMD